MSVVEQRSVALGLANEIRSRRFVERRQIRDLPVGEARERLGRLVLDCPAWVATVPIHKLLRWLPRLSEAKSARLLALIEASGFRSVGELTVRQRELLAVYLAVSDTPIKKERVGCGS